MVYDVLQKKPGKAYRVEGEFLLDKDFPIFSSPCALAYEVDGKVLVLQGVSVD